MTHHPPRVMWQNPSGTSPPRTSFFPVGVISISVTSSNTMFTYSSNPRNVPTTSLSPCQKKATAEERKGKGEKNQALCLLDKTRARGRRLPWSPKVCAWPILRAHVL